MVMHYGVFIQNIFDFVIVAFAILYYQLSTSSTVKEEPAGACPTKEEVLLTEI